MTDSDGKEVTLLPPNATTGYTPALLDSGTSVQVLPSSVLPILNSTLQNGLMMGDGEIIAIECSEVPKKGGFTYNFKNPQNSSEQAIIVSYDDIFTPIDENGIPDPTSSTCMLGATFGLPRLGEGAAILGGTVLSSTYVLYNFDNSTISIAQAKFGNSSDTSGTIALRKQ